MNRWLGAAGPGHAHHCCCCFLSQCESWEAEHSWTGCLVPRGVPSLLTLCGWGPGTGGNLCVCVCVCTHHRHRKQHRHWFPSTDKELHPHFSLEEGRCGFSYEVRFILCFFSPNVSTGWCCRNSYLLPWVSPSQKEHPAA